MIAIVDYGAGNLASVVKAVSHLGRECVVTDNADAVHAAEKLIIPGVGNFRATLPLTDGGLSAALREAIAGGKPVLGICLGLQWMFEGSDEASELRGLGVFPRKCTRFSERVKSPHVGWNRIAIEPRSQLLRGIPSGSYVYFTHSYWAPLCADTVATCVYEAPFTAAAERGNLFGVQFHPEKSGDVGMKILENFCAI
ncbi:MAG: imidazole glycerol phosphate synthase subunit HisH [Candidatus Korobacteraceae bacterium]